MKYSLFLFVFILFLFSCAKKTTSPSATSTAVRSATYRDKFVSTATMNADIINGVNEYRKTKGLPALHLLSIAASQAVNHSSNMASKKVAFGHAGFNQRAIAIANELHGTSSTGENIAFGKMTWKQVIDAWLKSPDHKANIEGSFDYTGVGVAKDSKGVVYYTQIFVKK
ncbi:MAG: CAP domain-containing protein [Bacteroidota bacterium]